MALDKELTFKSKGLGGDDVTLLLRVTPPVPDLLSTSAPQPVTFKTFLLHANAPSFSSAVKWNGKLCFLMPPTTVKSTSIPSTYQVIEIGHKTFIKGDGVNSAPAFHTPVPVEGLSSVQAVNKTGMPLHIFIGYMTDCGTPEEKFHLVGRWEQVPPGFKVTAQKNHLTPVLRVYAVQSSLQSDQPIWAKDLTTLGPHTTVSISRADNGELKADDKDEPKSVEHEHGAHIRPETGGVSRENAPPEDEDDVPPSSSGGEEKDHQEAGAPV